MSSIPTNLRSKLSFIILISLEIIRGWYYSLIYKIFIEKVSHFNLDGWGNTRAENVKLLGGKREKGIYRYLFNIYNISSQYSPFICDPSRCFDVKPDALPFFKPANSRRFRRFRRFRCFRRSRRTQHDPSIHSSHTDEFKFLL